MKTKKLAIVIGFFVVLAVSLALIRFHLQTSIADRVPDSVCVPSGYDSTCYGQPQTLSQEEATAIAVSTDQPFFASASRNAIHIWDLQTGRLKKSWQGHRNWVTALAISPNSRVLASASLDQTVKLWDLSTGALLGTVYPGRVTNLRFSPDGQTLATSSHVLRWADGGSSQSGVRLWDISTQELIGSFGNDTISAMAFSPDGKFLATGGKSTQVWRISNRRLVRTLNSGEVNALVFRPDDGYLISGSSKVKIWDIQTGKLLRILKTYSSDLALSSDGVTLASANGGVVNLWHLGGNRRFLGTLRGSHYSGLNVGFGLETPVLIAGSSDGLRIWRPQPDLTGQQTRRDRSLTVARQAQSQ